MLAGAKLYKATFGAFLLGLVWLWACQPDAELRAPYLEPFELKIPPQFGPMRIPEDNQLTLARVELGKRLFFDPMLSRDTSISCGSCHKPEKAFTDGLPLAQGVMGRFAARNAPSLTNVGFLNALNWDGGVPTLELHAFVPIPNRNEMDLSFDELVTRLRARPDYVEQFRRAYGRLPDNFSIVRALAAFQRTLISANSAFDRYILGDHDALTASQKRGLQLFNSERAECFHCHNGNHFTNNLFENNGLYLDYADEGRYRVSGQQRDAGKFKVPTLRNIELTGPYMHDGSIATLEQVVEHYMSGGQAHPNRSPLVRRFALSGQEKADLVAFLKSLTDYGFTQNPAFRP